MTAGGGQALRTLAPPKLGLGGAGGGSAGQGAATVSEGGGATWAGAGVLGPGCGWGLGVRVPHPAPLSPPLHGWGLRSYCSPRGPSCPALCLSLCSTCVLSAAHISLLPGLWPVSLGGEGLRDSYSFPLSVCELTPQSNPQHRQCVLAWERPRKGRRGDGVGCIRYR